MMFKRSRCTFFFIFIVCFVQCSAQNLTDSLQTFGTASFYHDNFQGLETSSGDIYNVTDFTAAHRTLPFNTFVQVTNKLNNKSVVVRINDRGPFNKSRIIDLARSPAQKLDMLPSGVAPVTIHILDSLDYLPLNDSILKENEIWDCYGNRNSLEGTTIFAWKTEYWKHSFYMASDLTVNYNPDCVYVKVVGKLNHRQYYLLISGIQNLEKAKALIKKLKKDGFKGARVLK
jgi:rare lipoprotein A